MWEIFIFIRKPEGVRHGLQSSGTLPRKLCHVEVMSSGKICLP